MQRVTPKQEAKAKADDMVGEWPVDQLMSDAQSDELLDRVVKSIQDREPKLWSYLEGQGDGKEQLSKKVSVQEMSEHGNLAYTAVDANPVRAANLANLFADELVNLAVKRDIEREMREVEALRLEAEQARKEVEAVREKLNALRQKFNRIHVVPEDYDSKVVERYQELVEELKEKNEHYQKLMERLQTEMSRVALVEPYVRIVEKATPDNARFVSPRRRYVAAGVGALLMAGVIGCRGLYLRKR